MRTISFKPPLERLSRSSPVLALRKSPGLAGVLFLAACSVLCPGAGFGRDVDPPVMVFNSISIQLDPSGNHALSSAEIATISAGSTDPSGITNRSVAPEVFNFCDLGPRTITLSLTDGLGNTTNRTGLIQVLPPAAPTRVYVDARYPSNCAQVTFPAVTGAGSHFIGFDAFSRI